MTTTRQDPIERALERLWQAPIYLHNQQLHSDTQRPILTDLAAEVRAECTQDYDGLDEDEIPTRLPDTLYLSEVWRSDQGLFFVCVPNDQPRVKRMAKYRNEFALGTPAEARLAAEIRTQVTHEIMENALMCDDLRRANKAEARLAAVVEYCEKWEKDGESYIPIPSVLALARGEGGEQAPDYRATKQSAADHRIPSAPAAPDATLDEIVRDTATQVDHLDRRLDVETWAHELDACIRAACIRYAEARLAAVREWRDSFGGDLPEYVGQEAYDQLDAILDGEDNNV